MEGFVEKRSTTLTGAAAKYQSRYFVLSSHYLRYTKKIPRSFGRLEL
jgi:hypothetical protein